MRSVECEAWDQEKGEGGRVREGERTARCEHGGREGGSIMRTTSHDTRGNQQLLGGRSTAPGRSRTVPAELSVVKDLGMWRSWDEDTRLLGTLGGEQLDLRDKAVAGGLAIGTAMVMVMMQSGHVYLVALAVLALFLRVRAIRLALLPPGRGTFTAYYVAWLFGPLGWGLYRRVRWAQVAGAALIVLLVARWVAV